MLTPSKLDVLRLSRHKTFVLLQLTFIYFLNQLDRYAIVPVNKELEQSLGFGDGQGSGIEYQLLAGPIFILIYSTAGVPFGVLGDKRNKVKLLFGCLLLWSAATTMMGWCQSYWQLAVLRAIQGLGQAGCTPLSTGLIGHLFSSQTLGSALGIYNWGIFFGFSGALGLGNFLKGASSWRVVFWCFGAAGLPAALLLILTVSDDQSQQQEHAQAQSYQRLPEQVLPKSNSSVQGDVAPDSGSLRSGGDGVPRSSSRGGGSLGEPLSAPLLSRAASASASQQYSLREVLRFFAATPAAMLLCAAGSVRNAAGFIWSYNTQTFYSNHYHLSDDQIAIFMSWVPIVSGALGASVGGWVSDRALKGRGQGARIWVLILCQICSVPFAAGMLLLPYPLCFISMIPCYVISEMWTGVSLAVLMDLVPGGMRATAISLYFFAISNIGGNANVVVPGLLNSVGDLWTYMILYPGLKLVAAVLFLGVLCMRTEMYESIDERLVSNATVARGAGNKPSLYGSYEADGDGGAAAAAVTAGAILAGGAGEAEPEAALLAARLVSHNPGGGGAHAHASLLPRFSMGQTGVIVPAADSLRGSDR